MKLFAIGDPHLSLARPKPMDIFGANWQHHFERIQQAWQQQVGAEDLVLVPGDISWAMQLADAKMDLDALGALPGNKLILRGNHDYWWSSLSKVRSILPQGMQALQNDAFRYGRFVIAGTRLWACPGAPWFDPKEDLKIYQREIGRLELSLKAAQRIRNADDALVVMLHYPPFNEKREKNEVTALLQEYAASALIYGHLHGKSIKYAFEGKWEDCQIHLVSADHLQFVPKLLGENGQLSESGKK